jgi:hypothetical protein
LRLVRLLTFIKGVEQLRVIVAGLVQGLRSVTYIVLLLFLVIYIFAIVASLTFGINDPARFGTVPVSMVSLFQVDNTRKFPPTCLTSRNLRRTNIFIFVPDPASGVNTVKLGSNGL